MRIGVIVPRFVITPLISGAYTMTNITLAMAGLRNHNIGIVKL